MGTDNYYSVKEDVQKYIDGCKTKMNVRTHKVFGRAVLAGMMIAFGASASNVAGLRATNGVLSRLVAGCVFPGGLTMVLIAGSELFTGNCLLTIPLLEQEITVSQMLKNWVIVYIGTHNGGILVAAGGAYSHHPSLYGKGMAVSV